LGLPNEVEPHEALLEEVWRTAGHVEWLGGVVRGLEPQQLVRGITKTVQFRDGTRTVEARAAPNLWIKLYQEERDRLVRVAKAAIDAGVDERQVRITEGQAQQLARVVSAIVTDLGHDLADEHVRKVVRLRLIEGGEARSGSTGWPCRSRWAARSSSRSEGALHSTKRASAGQGPRPRANAGRSVARRKVASTIAPWRRATAIAAKRPSLV
jgi:hypothetical protein